MFDPYHRWLAIPKGERPPTYYQLLGIAPDEAEADVIAEAALRQASHVRTYQTGPHAEQCTALLNEIARARNTLLHPDRRRNYDTRLGLAGAPKNLPQASPSPSPSPSQETRRQGDKETGRQGLEDQAPGDVLAGSPFAFDGQVGARGPASAARSPARARAGAVPAALAYAALLLLGGVLGFWVGRDPPQRGPLPSEPDSAPPAKTKPASPAASMPVKGDR